METFICPCCSGDGKETCHNPDHGFYSMISFHEVGRLGCPCCGHDPNHKVKYKGKIYPCEVCEGAGTVSEETGIKFLEEMKYDFELTKKHP